MFNRSRPVSFNPYGRRPSRWRWARWIVGPLALMGLGAAAVIVAQERYLPPRLSVGASAQLQQDIDAARGDAQRLAAELAQARSRLAAVTTDSQALGKDLATQRAAVERLQGDLASVVAALPPDPRSGAVEVRAARFAASGGMLAYDVVLTREPVGKAGRAPMTGTMQLVVTGESAQKGPTSVTMKPIALSMGSHEVVRGSQPLPEGFKPQQTTVRVLDRPAGQLLGMRQLLVR